MKILGTILLMGLMVLTGFAGTGHAGPNNILLAANSSLNGLADKAFGNADTDNDGVITRSEFDAARSKRFTEKDANGDGSLSSDEFKTGLPRIVQRNAERKFNEMDSDNNGLLSRSEFDAGGDSIFKRLDTNGDGRLTKEEMPRFGGMQ